MEGDGFSTARSVGLSSREVALIESSERYSSLFTYHPHATYSVDRRGYYTDVNARALAMTGLTLEQMRQTHFSQVIHPEDVHVIRAGFESALDGDPQLADARVLRPDGQVVDIRCTMIPVVVGGEVVGVHGVTEDVTEAKRIVRQLEEANAAKDLFLANVSHEVRTPLASIIGATELLMEVDLDPEAQRFADMVHRSGQRLLRLVNDILDFSRLQAHQLALLERPFEVRGVLAGVADWAVHSAESRHVTISFGVDESVPTWVLGDRDRVSQVVAHLVHNALKFTESGGVDVWVECRAPEADPDDLPGAQDVWVEFTVADTGIGIAEELLPGLFEPFTQADPSSTRGYGGAGLGLAVCRDLANLMGGRLQASSRIGEGSTFTFGVPLRRVVEGGASGQEP